MQIYNILLMRCYDDHFTPTSRKIRAKINDNKEVQEVQEGSTRQRRNEHWWEIRKVS